MPSGPDTVALLPDQRYVAHELTHFVGRGIEETGQYRLLVEVLRSGVLAPPRDLGLARVAAADADAVCFCDVPLPDLHVHMRKYSSFGLAFRKSFLVERGANPVFYVARGHPLLARLPDDLVPWTKAFEPGLDDGHPENVYLEREWRVLGPVRFRLADVHRVVLPDRYAEALRRDVPEYRGQVDYSG